MRRAALAGLLFTHAASSSCAAPRHAAPAPPIIIAEAAPAPSPPPQTPALPAPRPAPPSYLVRLATDGEVMARDGRGAIVVSRPDDNAVLRAYPEWTDKGRIAGPAAERLTILSAKSVYSPLEEIRIIHVHEATASGVYVYVMGPKAIYGEYVDGVLTSPAATAPPSPYDGRVIESPWEDHNYEPSVYRLPVGDHTIEWRFATLSSPVPLRSNVLVVKVR